MSCQDRQSGREYLADGYDTPLFRLLLTRAGDQSGDTVTLGSNDAAHMTVTVLPQDGGQDAVELHYSGFADWPQLAVHCRIAARNDDALLRWRLRVSVSGAPTLVRRKSVSAAVAQGPPR